jgi:hypothetical protein
VSRRWLDVSYDAPTYILRYVQAVPTRFHLQKELVPRSSRSRATVKQSHVELCPRNLLPNSDPGSEHGYRPTDQLSPGSANKGTLYPGVRSATMRGLDVAPRKPCGPSLSLLESLRGAAFPRLWPLRSIHWREGATTITDN